MQAEELDHILEQTLADGRLSRSEKRALEMVLAEGGTDARQLAAIRHRVFEIAGRHLPGPEAQAILGWLEDVLKVLQPKPVAAAQPAEAYFSPDDDCAGKIASLLKRAARSVDICVFTITDNRIAEAILQTHGKGVAVRIVTDNYKVHDVGSDVERLAQAGIPVRLDRSEHHMHHKFAVFDHAAVLTGSYNWTRGAAHDNLENFAVCYERRLVETFAAKFEAIWRDLA
jgi:phosphatidylserine/phosphatidylglycerophosphate/cardiolipin synthase-like enzyme